MVPQLTAPALFLVILSNLYSLTAGVPAVRAADLPTVIDTHIHLYDPTRPGGIPWPRQGHELYRTYMPAEFAAVAGPAGVTAAVIVEASPLVEDNQWMLDLMEDEPSLVALVGRLDLRSDSFTADLARFAASPRFAGIRRNVTRADLTDERIMANLRDLQRRNLTLDMALGQGMTLADARALAVAVPDLRIVINHLASRHIDGAAPDSVWAGEIQALGQYRNVYMKVSGLYQNTKAKPAPIDVAHYASTLDVVWEAFGEDRLVYGSNWPVSTMYGEYAPNIDIARSYFATRGSVVMEKVMGRNAVTAYNLKLDN